MSRAWFQSLNEWDAALVLTGIEIAGDLAAKFESPAIAVLVYLKLGYVLSEVLPGNRLSVTNAYWNALTNVTHVILGTVLFKEKVSPKELGGIGLITAGILLMK